MFAPAYLKDNVEDEAASSGELYNWTMILFVHFRLPYKNKYDFYFSPFGPIYVSIGPSQAHLARQEVKGPQAGTPPGPDCGLFKFLI